MKVSDSGSWSPGGLLSKSDSDLQTSIQTPFKTQQDPKRKYSKKASELSIPVHEKMTPSKQSSSHEDTPRTAVNKLRDEFEKKLEESKKTQNNINDALQAQLKDLTNDATNLAHDVHETKEKVEHVKQTVDEIKDAQNQSARKQNEMQKEANQLTHKVGNAVHFISTVNQDVHHLAAKVEGIEVKVVKTEAKVEEVEAQSHEVKKAQIASTGIQNDINFAIGNNFNALNWNLFHTNNALNATNQQVQNVAAEVNQVKVESRETKENVTLLTNDVREFSYGTPDDLAERQTYDHLFG